MKLDGGGIQVTEEDLVQLTKAKIILGIKDPILAAKLQEVIEVLCAYRDAQNAKTEQLMDHVNALRQQMLAHQKQLAIANHGYQKLGF